MVTTQSFATAAVPAPPPPRPAPLRRILCTIDFSEASVAAVAEAVALARACRGEITVLFVLPYAAPSRADALNPQVPAGVSSAVTEDVEALLEPARAAGIQVRVCLKAGRPAHEILEVVRRTNPDVIVMGTHGRGGLKRWALGSVTHEVLRNAACPVLTVAHRWRNPAVHVAARSHAVVCAVGLSPSSPRTVVHACQVARATGASLTLLHVLEGHAMMTDMREAGRRLHALTAAHGLPGDRIEEVVVAGVPARQILNIAAARNAALVVVGGESLSDRVLFGSTPDQVIRGAQSAVLTVRSSSEGA